MQAHLRIARPVTALEQSVAMYSKGLGLTEIGRFENHEGFDGVMLGGVGFGYHFEFTYCRTHPVRPSHTPEDLVVFYLPDHTEWQRTCQSMLEAGFTEVSPFNPYWQQRGRTFEDQDHYRVVLEQAEWRVVSARKASAAHRAASIGAPKERSNPSIEGTSSTECFIRNACRDDVPAMATLTGEFSRYMRSLDDTTDLRLDAEALERDGFGTEPAFRGLIAEVSGEVVGFLLHHAGYDTDAACRLLFVVDLYVTESARGQGIGAALMNEAGKIAAAGGARQIVWTIDRRNALARHFYEGLGASYIRSNSLT